MLQSGRVITRPLLVYVYICSSAKAAALFPAAVDGPDAGAAGPALCAVPRAAAPPLLLEVPHGEDEPDDQADYE